jgi:hypothetical protein
LLDNPDNSFKYFVKKKGVVENLKIYNPSSRKAAGGGE